MLRLDFLFLLPSGKEEEEFGVEEADDTDVLQDTSG